MWSSAPRAREGQRGQIHIQCVLISKTTSSLPRGWKLRCQAGQDKRALWDKDPADLPREAAAPMESQCSGVQGTRLGPGPFPK